MQGEGGGGSLVSGSELEEAEGSAGKLFGGVESQYDGLFDVGSEEEDWE